MTVKEAWQHLEDAQQHLERFIESHGGVFDEDAGAYIFPVVSETREFGGLNAATLCIGDAQGYLESLIDEGD
jgi:hypothetical protein